VRRGYIERRARPGRIFSPCPDDGRLRQAMQERASHLAREHVRMPGQQQATGEPGTESDLRKRGARQGVEQAGFARASTARDRHQQSRQVELDGWQHAAHQSNPPGRVLGGIEPHLPPHGRQLIPQDGEVTPQARVRARPIHGNPPALMPLNAPGRPAIGQLTHRALANRPVIPESAPHSVPSRARAGAHVPGLPGPPGRAERSGPPPLAA